jgi:GGDEF domain-containing protein
MAQIFSRNKSFNELLQTASQKLEANQVYTNVDRLLIGAAKEGLLLSFLYMRITDFFVLYDRFPVRRVRKLVSDFLKILIDKTPDDIYVDCPGPNEFALMLPGVSKEDVQKAGLDIRLRFLDLCQSILKDDSIKIDIIGSVVAFPEDGANCSELLCQARDAMHLAIEDGADPIQIAKPYENVKLSVNFSATQIKRLKKIAESQQFTEQSLIREAIDQILFKYE